MYINPCKLLCYLVDCDGEYGAQVYFAKTRGQAKAMAANEEECRITEVVSCRRKPEWDTYSPGPVPIKVLMEAGWGYECSGCGQMVYEGGECYHGDNDESCDTEPVYTLTQVWCCQSCRDASEIRGAKRKIEEAEARRAALAAFAAKWPEVKPSKVIERYTGICVEFHIPGAEDSVLWEVGSDSIWISWRCMEAWYAWEDSRLGPVMSWEDDGGAVAA